MSAAPRMKRPSRPTIGTALIGLGGVILLVSAAAKLARVPLVVQQLGAFGFTGPKLVVVAVLELVSSLLFLIPRTRSTGLLLVSAFLGGAIATHLQHDDPVVQPAFVLVLLWLGAWLRHPEMLWSLRQMEPRSTSASRPAEAEESRRSAATGSWRFVPWLSRFVLLAATVIFSLIAEKYLTNPVAAAAMVKISLGSAAAVTNMRVGFGAFPLGSALITLACLLSARRRLLGLWFVIIIIGVAAAARLLGILVDGPAQESLQVLRPELVLFTLSAVGVLLESHRPTESLAGLARSQPSAKHLV
jgi:DoxX-like family/Domain of unknown function (DUF4345)